MRDDDKEWASSNRSVTFTGEFPCVLAFVATELPELVEQVYYQAEIAYFRQGPRETKEEQQFWGRFERVSEPTVSGPLDDGSMMLVMYLLGQAEVAERAY